ncbi:MAG TPA: SRPBCC family protein [Candidatus Acidoferrales bacterium]|nr:SRPBCC family protein [Candidatus Acidoferrales bacterium]
MPKRQPPAPIVESLAVAVSPARAWDALTNPRFLGDIMMGHVELDARPGQPFVWKWGVWDEAAPGKGSHDWRGTVLDVVPGSMLILSGGASTAVLTVNGEGNSSLITAVQMVTEPSAGEDFQYGWADFLLRVKTLLEPHPSGDALYLRTLMRATPAEVIGAWLSPTVMSKILPGKVTLKAKPGGRFAWQWKHPKGAKNSGAFLEITKGRHVAFTWEGGPQPSEVRLSAERTPYGAFVSLEHLRLPPGASRRAIERMWAHLLERLRVYFYFGKKIRAGKAADARNRLRSFESDAEKFFSTEPKAARKEARKFQKASMRSLRKD